jgi:hypothetical protein
MYFRNMNAVVGTLSVTFWNEFVWLSVMSPVNAKEGVCQVLYNAGLIRCQEY